MTTPSTKTPDIRCPLCHDTGWQYVNPENVKRCECRSPTSLESLERTMEAARIPPRYLKCELTNYEPQGAQLSREMQSQRDGLLYCRNFVREFPNVDRGLLLMGPVGVGKTHLAVATLKELIRRMRARCIFYDFRDLLKEIQDTYNPISQTSELRILAPIYNAEVLVLDELGAAKPTAWVQDTMTQIINTRYNRNKPTIFTTNYPDKPPAQEESLTDRVGARLRSRLYEMCREVPIEGHDFRDRRHI
ncbi:MAG: ATP-binding protein [Acidobacteria bacterium]|nr:ATP-binding protein [Acidobacteriota bacterium]